MTWNSWLLNSKVEMLALLGESRQTLAQQTGCSLGSIVSGWRNVGQQRIPFLVQVLVGVLELGVDGGAGVLEPLVRGALYALQRAVHRALRRLLRLFYGWVGSFLSFFLGGLSSFPGLFLGSFSGLTSLLLGVFSSFQGLSFCFLSSLLGAVDRGVYWIWNENTKLIMRFYDGIWHSYSARCHSSSIVV